MAYFPLCVELRGSRILLVGSGAAAAEKLEKLRPFGPEIRRLQRLDTRDLTEDIAMVIAADQEPAEARRISSLCRQMRIPVNIPDQPELCSFFFPALITRGDLTVSVSTGGKSPAGAACVAARLEDALPDSTAQILDWLHQIRQTLYASLPREAARAALRRITARSFELERVLTKEELQAVM